MKSPKIRFKGYVDDWEQRKLGEMADKTYGGGTPKTSENEFWNGNIPWIQSSDLVEDQVLNVTYKKNITEVGLEKSAAQLVPEKSIAIVTRVGVGKLVYMPFSYTTSQDFLSLSELKVDAKYACYSIYKMLQKEKNATQGTSIKGITKAELLNKTISVPEIEEQIKIGSYFTALDRLITLHQRKCEQVKKLKKYMLQKMFPKNGSKIPEIRFDGFSDDWEQCKLNEYLDVSNKKNKDDIYGKEDVLSVSGDFGIVNQIEFQGRSFAGASVLSYGVVCKGDVVYTKSPLSSNPYGIIKTNKGNTGIVSTLYAVYHPKENVNSEFVQIYFDYNPRMNNYMNPLVNKGAKNDMKVSAENALKGFVTFPELEEQNAIVKGFRQIDHLITLHQRKCFRKQKIGKTLGNSVSWGRWRIL